MENLLFNQNSSLAIKEYIVNLSEYRDNKDQRAELEAKRKSLRERLGGYIGLIWIPIIISIGIYIYKNYTDELLLLLIPLFIVVTIINEELEKSNPILNFISFGKLDKLDTQIKNEDNNYKEIRRKLYEFESVVRTNYQNQLDEFYNNNLYRKRSGNKQFEEALVEFSSLINELSKVNSTFVTTSIHLSEYKEYLSKRYIDHGNQQLKESAELKSIRNLVKRIVKPDQLLQPSTLPPEKVYKSISVVRDWDKINKMRHATGLKGEEIAVIMEKEYFTKINRKDLADKVRHISLEVGDGLGYDVLSFFEDGREKYIEVKSTTSSLAAPYYLSKNELEFLQENGESAFIYRFLINTDIPQVLIHSGTEVLRINQILPVKYIVQSSQLDEN